jgi:gluconolactonase
VTDQSLQAANDFLNTTEFVAFDPSFFDLIGSEARVEHVWDPANVTIHEAACFIPELNSLYFASWGFNHDWQFLLNASTNEVQKITTDPPIMNAHGCQMYKGSLYITTDGGDGHYASIVKVDPLTWKSEVMLNNFYQQPFLGFNDLDIDPQGNIWLTDSASAWVSSL